MEQLRLSSHMSQFVGYVLIIKKSSPRCSAVTHSVLFYFHLRAERTSFDDNELFFSGSVVENSHSCRSRISS